MRFVAHEASAGDLQFPVAFELPGDERLGAGMVAEVELDLGRAGRGLAVPLDALDRDAEGAFVWLLGGGRVHRRGVVVAGSRGGDAVVSEGLEAGDLVVVSASERLAENLAVGQVSEARAR